MTMRGADLVIEALVASGVRQIFTVSGNHIMSLYDATVGRDLRLVHTRHEAAAVHMADAWGRMTGRAGVALVTAGPGHANALSALYTARLAESPVLFLSGHCPRDEVGAGGFQEMEQVAMATPVTKAAWLCESPETLAADVTAALELAESGTPGPVHLSLPGDVLEAVLDATASVRVAPAAAPVEPADRLSDASLSAVLDTLAAGSRPLILVGPAMARDPRWSVVERLAAVVGAPALPIESPRGVNDPWLRTATRALAQADVVLLLGKALDFSLRFGASPAFAPECRFLQIASGAPVPPKAIRIGFAVSADPGQAAVQLLEGAGARVWRRTGWRDEVLRARMSRPAEWAALSTSAATPIHPLRVCAAIERHVEAGAILVCDGGEFGQWIQAGVDPHERLINGLAGSIGSGLPMGIAAKLARPERPVLVALGDGAFGFHPLELDTALRYGLPLVVVVGNDARWNAEYQIQLRRYGPERAVGCDLLPSRYDLVATALGGYGELVERPDDLEGALERAVASGRPAILNVTVAPAAAPTFR